MTTSKQSKESELYTVEYDKCWEHFVVADRYDNEVLFTRDPDVAMFTCECMNLLNFKPEGAVDVH